LAAGQIVSASQASIGSLPAQRLWWRVRARNAAGVFGPFSSSRRITPAAASAEALALAVPMGRGGTVGNGQMWLARRRRPGCGCGLSGRMLR
jgi:hypothetical protein